MSHVAVDSELRPGQLSVDQRLNVFRLNQAAYDAKRLASFRRALGTVLMALGTPVLILSQATDPRIRHALTILSILWLMLVLPMVRLLFMEGKNRRLLTNLRTLVHAPRRRLDSMPATRAATRSFRGRRAIEQR